MTIYKKKHWKTPRKKLEYPQYTGMELHPNVKNLAGQTFGYLKVIAPDHDKRSKKKHWICECLRCGNITSKSGYLLRNGQTKSCGCLMKDNVSKNLGDYLF